MNSVSHRAFPWHILLSKTLYDLHKADKRLTHRREMLLFFCSQDMREKLTGVCIIVRGISQFLVLIVAPRAAV
jgi:hypothetical protein